MADSIEPGKPKVRTHKDSGLQYLCGKDKVLFENGVVLDRKDFEHIKSVPGGVRGMVDEYLASKPENCGWDFVYSCTTGNLRKRKASGTLEANARTVKHRAKQTKKRRCYRKYAAPTR